MRRLPKVLFWFVVGVLFVGLVSGCSQPPGPSAETAALEPVLLTVGEVGGSFEEESRGQVGVSGSGLCPETEFRFDDVGVVRAAFVWLLGGDDQVELVEMLFVVEADGIGSLMADIEAAYASCDGVVWTDYGTTQTVDIVDAPDIGDARLAVRRIEGEPPFDQNTTERTILYVAEGDIFVEISTDVRAVSEDEFYRIAATAIDKLPT